MLYARSTITRDQKDERNGLTICHLLLTMYRLQLQLLATVLTCVTWRQFQFVIDNFMILIHICVTVPNLHMTQKCDKEIFVACY